MTFRSRRKTIYDEMREEPTFRQDSTEHDVALAFVFAVVAVSWIMIIITLTFALGVMDSYVIDHAKMPYGIITGLLNFSSILMVFLFITIPIQQIISYALHYREGYL